MIQKVIHCLFFGPTNSGKSTLINKLVGSYISIVSRKCQATRDIIKGIFEVDNTQYVCIDTPGLFDKDKNSIIDRKMIKDSMSMINESLIENGYLPVLIVDKFNYDSKDVKNLLDRFLVEKKQICILINKQDITSEKRRIDIINFIYNYSDILLFNCFISAKRSTGLKNFISLSSSYALESEWEFVNDEITDKNENFMISEMTREYIYDNYHEEIPYKTYVNIDRVDIVDDLTTFWQTIFIPKNKLSYKRIIEGNNKYKLVKSEEILSQRCSKLLNKKVSIKLHVKSS